MGTQKTVALTFSAILVVALAAGFSPNSSVDVNNPTDTATATASPSTVPPAATHPTRNPSPVITNYVAKPLPAITAEEKERLRAVEIQTEKTLNNLIVLAETPANSNFMISLDRTKDPETAASLIRANRGYIDSVNQMMTLSDSLVKSTDAMTAKGVTDPKTVKELAVVVEHIVFSSVIHKQVINTKNFEIAVIPGSFRTESGKIIIPRDSLYVQDENYAIVDFIHLQGDIVVEQDGNLLNFDNYRQGATKETSLESNWVTDAELFKEFDKNRYTYSNAEQYAEYLNQNFKYGGLFTVIPILGMDYIHMEHPASLLNEDTEVFYRFDKP